jgi:hypothetical protein
MISICFPYTYVHKKKGGKIKYTFSKLVDGVHPTIDLSRSWFKHMEKVVSENEENLVVMDTMESVLHFIIILIKFQDICLLYRVSMKIPLTKTRCT